jgi:hypothetical protein
MSRRKRERNFFNVGPRSEGVVESRDHKMSHVSPGANKNTRAGRRIYSWDVCGSLSRVMMTLCYL